MKENLKQMQTTLTSFWQNRSKVQKSVFIGSTVLVVMLIGIILFFANQSNLVPLYSNLSAQEAGQIKTELDARGVTYEIANGGTTITVPDNQVDSLLIDLAGQGIPNSGNIDYSFFSENASWGITDNEFDVIKLDAMQTELANLIKGIDGIENASVMITMPKETVFVSEAEQPASVAIKIHTKPGYQFQGNQIDALYHLVSKAVPNVTPENIVITNQYLESFERNSKEGTAQEGFAYQQGVKKDIERDLQVRVQNMLGSMVGMENVVVSVTTDVDFTQENRVEELVDPVDEETMEGLPVSIESIHETYTGGQVPGGTSGTGEEDTAGTYQATEDEDGDYELVKETINNEFNRIQKEIVESPYKVRDLGIQVVVNRVKERDGDKIEYLSQNDQALVEQGIASILQSIVRTSIDKEYEAITPEENISIVFQEFSESASLPQTEPTGIPLWMYVTGGALLILIALLLIMLLRKRETVEEETIMEVPTPAVNIQVPDIGDTEETEAIVRKKQLEKMAKEKPDDFAKLLRSWIGED